MKIADNTLLMIMKIIFIVFLIQIVKMDILKQQKINLNVVNMILKK